MPNFVTLYRGDTISSAKLVAVSADPALVREFAKRLLAEQEKPEPDPVLMALEAGRVRALNLVRNAASE